MRRKKQQRRHQLVPAFACGSGGGIRTPDLWVMSPTSCRCSTPRRDWRSAVGSELSACGSELFASGLLAVSAPRRTDWEWGVPAAASPPVGSPPQYSPALRWVTTGFGMGPGGASTLSATGTPHPPTGGVGAPCCASPAGRPPGRRPLRSCPLARAPCSAAYTSHWYPCLSRVAWRPRPDEGKLPHAGAGRPAVGSRPRKETNAGSPPSTIRTARLQSVARGPPAAYQPGHLPGVLPRNEWGCSSWGGIPA